MDDVKFRLAQEIYDSLRGEVRKKCGRYVDRSVIVSQIYLVLERRDIKVSLDSYMKEPYPNA